jgi:hypothetical protein
MVGIGCGRMMAERDVMLMTSMRVAYFERNCIVDSDRRGGAVKSI